MDAKEKRKYALACRRIELGSLQCAPHYLKAIHLTTRMGDDNTPERLQKDFRMPPREEKLFWRNSLYNATFKSKGFTAEDMVWYGGSVPCFPFCGRLFEAKTSLRGKVL